MSDVDDACHGRQLCKWYKRYGYGRPVEFNYHLSDRGRAAFKIAENKAKAVGRALREVDETDPLWITAAEEAKDVPVGTAQASASYW